jgi:hypothetical protein
MLACGFVEFANVGLYMERVTMGAELVRAHARVARSAGIAYAVHPDTVAVTAVVDELRKDLSQQPAVVDVAELVDGTHHHLSVAWGAVVANVAASAISSQTALTVELPTSQQTRLQAGRSGLLFALARHRGLDWDSLRKADRALIEAWTNDWQPADVRQPLFSCGVDPADVSAPDREIVAFLNPDRAPRSHTMNDQNAVVFPWLRAMMADAADDGEQWREALLGETALAAQELLDNVRQHAHLGHSDLCSVSYCITANDATGGAQLHLTVFDNGRGIPRTAARHFDEHHDADDPLSLVDAAFNGELPNRLCDRGRGLNRLTHLAQRRRGRLFAATSNPGGDGSVVVDFRPDDSTVASQYLPGLEVTGTVVVLTLPLTAPEHAARDDSVSDFFI